MTTSQLGAAAMHGLMSDGFFAESPENTAKAAVRYADALIAELDREPQR